MTNLKLTNNTDLQLAHRGMLAHEGVRVEEVEALVDTGATGLVLPADVVARLGLREEGTKKVRYADGRFGVVPWVSGVRIEILGREMSCDAVVHPTGTTPLVGQIPLETMARRGGAPRGAWRRPASTQRKPNQTVREVGCVRRQDAGQLANHGTDAGLGRHDDAGVLGSRCEGIHHGDEQSPRG